MERLSTRAMLSLVLLASVAAGCNAAGSAPPLAASTVSDAMHASKPNPIVNLRTSGNFAILAGTTVTNTGSTRITGDVGIFPGTAITGFPPGKISGTLYAGGPTAKQAQLDLTTAYNNAMGRVNSPIAVAGNLGGQTLAPGLYKSTSGLAVTSGTLTLDGHGNRNAVFIFQMASTFTMTTGRRVELTNGARSKNIFWAVGSSASLGTGCRLFGNLLAHQSISMATGSVLRGRALARLGAVTMQHNTLLKPPN